MCCACLLLFLGDQPFVHSQSTHTRNIYIYRPNFFLLLSTHPTFFYSVSLLLLRIHVALFCRIACDKQLFSPRPTATSFPSSSAALAPRSTSFSRFKAGGQKKKPDTLKILKMFAHPSPRFELRSLEDAVGRRSARTGPRVGHECTLNVAVAAGILLVPLHRLLQPLLPGHLWVVVNCRVVDK